MDKAYLHLFEAIIQAAEVLAEKVMEYDEKQNDLEGKRTAEIMRDDYASLHDKISGNDDVVLTKADFAKLLVAAYIVSNNMEIQAKQLERTLNNYKTLIIPKLSRINDETNTNEEVEKLANEIFGKIEETNT